MIDSYETLEARSGVPLCAEVIPVLKIEGPPGSGKTRALAREACCQLAGGNISASQVLILCQTHLNKIRLRQALSEEAKAAGVDSSEIKLRTFEEWFLALSQEFSPPGSPPVKILQDSDACILLQEMLRQLVPPEHPLYYASRQPSFSRGFHEVIRQLQLQDITPAEIRKNCATAAFNSVDSRFSLLAELYECFQRKLEVAGLQSPVMLAQNIFNQFQTVARAKETVARRYSLILADEAQEFSEIVHHILSGLLIPLMLAGNAKLSIRSFRGARPDLFSDLSLSYPGRPVKTLSLDLNRRGNDPLLNLVEPLLPGPLLTKSLSCPADSLVASLVQPHAVSSWAKFGCYPDPETEALGVAAYLRHFVETVQLEKEKRPAGWQDCVILLRSSHYREHLINALNLAQIPFRSGLLSESQSYLQQVLFDLFNVFADWQNWRLSSGCLRDPEVFKRHIDQLDISVQERAASISRNNRHLSRYLSQWLEAGNSAPGISDDLKYLRPQKNDETQDEESLLKRLGDEAVPPPTVYSAMQTLIGLYERYQENACPEGLLGNALATLLPHWHSLDLEQDFSDLIAAVQKNLERLNAHYQSTFKKPLSLALLVQHFPGLWENLEPLDNRLSNTVRLLSIHQVQGEEFPLVMIPFVVAEEFPLTRNAPELFPNAETWLPDIRLNYCIDVAEEARLMAVGLTRGSRQAVITCHRNQSGAPVLPSSFYLDMLAQKRHMAGESAEQKLCLHNETSSQDKGDCGFDLCSWQDKRRAELLNASSVDDIVEAESLQNRYIGNSLWAKLKPEEAEPLFCEQEILSISASSIKTYMTCPRQFFYKHLLKLPQPGSEAANLGSLIHRVMEVFNLQAQNTETPSLTYRHERLKEVALAMFSFETAPQEFYQAGFQEQDAKVLGRMSPLSLTALQHRLSNAIDDLTRKGYFDRYGTLKQVHPEQPLSDVVLDGLDRCRFSGKMDAVIQLSDGSWEILDYKSFRSPYSSGFSHCEAHFARTLDPLPDEALLTHAERFASKLNPAYPQDYQLPLYFLACLQQAVYRDHLRGIVLQVIRPAFPDKPEQGAIRLSIEAEAIERQKDQMIEDINRYIVSPILEGYSFQPCPSRSACGSCGYLSICEAGDASDLDMNSSDSRTEKGNS